MRNYSNMGCGNDKSEIIKNIIETGRILGSKNYSPGYSGNISTRYGENIIITTSGSSNGYLSPNDFVEIDFRGKPINSGKKPSSEKLLHIEFYKMRSDINCIIHVHPAGLSAFAAAGKDLTAPVMAENVFYFGGIPLAEYAMPSSKELAANTAKFFNKYDAVLMANHGFIIGSSSLYDACQKLEIAEEYAKTVIYTKALGGAIPLNGIETKKITAMRSLK
ncbi:MAG: class II aldolase/adducin family protein [Candidatus Gastranaerophilales bacterium]|nr:class II aldolase/adducin family protein [Candidatus Gastranaerophilales bacterium]